uniref:E3 ubiquitin-protein ligase RING1-like n=1 Tax=Fragaria vesca subsp. vesca TaxID=101020 RepID=UPI0005C8D25F|nr:PREDICTED: E3 ubiquitin-protein ligase RING1-like [Fragaria vesca subsp. vesca]
MDVPERAQSPIIEEIFKVVDVAVPKLPVVVAIVDITDVDSGGIFPATKPAIRSLEKVRLDSLDEATITRTPSCVICLKDLDRQHMITRLPCSHAYHADCVITWLETSHYCPVCRYSMPFIPECQLSTLSGGKGISPLSDKYKYSIYVLRAEAQAKVQTLQCPRAQDQAKVQILQHLSVSGSGQGANPSKSKG